jgi:hypothetical protein
MDVCFLKVRSKSVEAYMIESFIVFSMKAYQQEEAKQSRKLSIDTLC